MFPGRLGLQQRILPAYRASFFDELAKSCQCGLSVYAGLPLPEESIHTTEQLVQAHYVRAENHHFLKPGSSFHLCWQAGLIEWLESWQPDVLIVEANPRYLTTRKAVRWMHSRGLPVLGWGLGAPRREGDSPIKRFLAGALDTFSFIHSLDGMIAYSKRGAEEYRRLGIPASKIVVSPNAVAPRPLVPPPARSLGFYGNPAILFVGRLQHRKRVDLLLQACAELPAEVKPRLWIVGEGPALGDLKALAARIFPSAEFVGAVHGEQLGTYFNSADLFVLPGTGGLAVQEAMAHALPVIVARGDGTQDDLVRHGNGWLVPSDDLKSLKAALEKALSDPGRLRRMGLESYRIVVEEVNLEAMVGVFIAAVNSVSRLMPGDSVGKTST